MTTAATICARQLATGYRYQEFGPGLEPGEKMEQKLSALDGLLPETIAGSVLDIGCNLGFFTFLAEQRGASSVVGVDTSAARLKWCREFAAATGSRAQFVGKLADEQAAGTFDLVLCMSVGHHLFGGDLGELFRQMAARVNPGGLFIYEGPVGVDDYVVVRNGLEWTADELERELAGAFGSWGYHGEAVHAHTRHVYWGRK